MKKMTNFTYLNGSFILFDTSVLIDGIKYQDEYQSFFDFIKEQDCTGLLDATVRCEFLAGARNDSEMLLLSDFLQSLFGSSDPGLRISTETFETARKLMNCVYRAENKHLKIPDALIGSQIVQYSSVVGNLLLATQNHHDFPPVIFERKYTQNINLPDGKIKTVGIYDVRTDYKALLSKSPQSSAKK